MLPDLINGLFEIGGAFAISLSIAKLLKDKKLVGYHWGTLVFFTSWGYWNLWYYPHLGQWFSLVAGVLVTIVNSVYLWLIFHFRRK